MGHVVAGILFLAAFLLIVGAHDFFGRWPNGPGWSRIIGVLLLCGGMYLTGIEHGYDSGYSAAMEDLARKPVPAMIAEVRRYHLQYIKELEDARQRERDDKIEQAILWVVHWFR